MADFCSDFCCSVTFTLFYFSYISYFLTSFSFIFCSISLIYSRLFWLNVQLVWFDDSCSCWSSVVCKNLIHGLSDSHGSVNSTCRCLSAVWWFNLLFVQVVQFYQSVSVGLSAVHGSCSSIGSSCRSVAGSVGSVVCLFIQSA